MGRDVCSWHDRLEISSPEVLREPLVRSKPRIGGPREKHERESRFKTLRLRESFPIREPGGLRDMTSEPSGSSKVKLIAVGACETQPLMVRGLASLLRETGEFQLTGAVSQLEEIDGFLNT